MTVIWNSDFTNLNNIYITDTLVKVIFLYLFHLIIPCLSSRNHPCKSLQNIDFKSS